MPGQSLQEPCSGCVGISAAVRLLIPVAFRLLRVKQVGLRGGVDNELIPSSLNER